MSGAVIHRFKLIQVDKHQHMLMLMFSRIKQQTFKLKLETGTVRQAGQGVMQRAIAQPLHQFARLTHILNNHYGTLFQARLGAQRCDAVVNIDMAAIGRMQHQIVRQTGGDFFRR